MLIPLIANGPLQGPPPTPIAGHGAAQDPASQTAKQDTKDTFGALFSEGDMAKKPSAVAQETGIPVDGETPEDEIGLEGSADQDTDFETEPDVAPGLITSDQDDAPDRTETATLVAPNRFDPDTQNDLGKQVSQNPELRNVKANQDTNLETVENMVPDQEGPATPAAPAANRNVAVPTTGPAEQTPIEGAKAQPLAASAAAIIAKTAENSTNLSKRGQASALAEIASAERSLDQTAKTDRLTMPSAPVHAANAPPVLPPQHAKPAPFPKSLTTEVEVSALDDKPIAFEARTLGASSAAMAVPTQALAQRADLPQHIAMQIAAAAQRGGAGRPIDIVLNPAELGPVRLSLASADGVMSVTVIAERPETLDLMRRHIDTLAQEFLNIGYGKAQFSFGGGQSGQTGQKHSDTSHSPAGGSGPQAPITETPNLHHTPILISDRLDIRL
ncbi:Flagellar hook-length control protein FliK [Roseovarius marisflavi]|uniref:Flagellar hook-length control protein FliK n=2 Tax=Roseovarius marisflavi TaxID=1054996 RepID=A0A1M6Z7S5_9RHOB|nr:Flagellar hook-length control protein FliK [Roseovarius marisflavi]